MPRQPRIDAPGTLHHVIARGIDRGELFRDDRDRSSFLDRLGPILEETGTACYAWVLIPNHFHLLLRTGTLPLATAMRRLMTGHAVSFNKRHGRHGHLFQNRYRSIVCQEDAYFLELVRYIHLNPLRAGIVETIDQLDRYPFSGHAVLVGLRELPWQKTGDVLTHFGTTRESARRDYRRFVSEGLDEGKRPDLSGAGLMRSTGGLKPARDSINTTGSSKRDERILGDSDFVSRTLAAAEKVSDRYCELKARGITVDGIIERVATLLDINAGDVVCAGKHKSTVTARSLVCYLAVRELGVSMTSLAERFGISTVAVSKSVKRGFHIAKEREGELRDLLL